MEKLSPRAQAPLDAGKQPSALGLHDLPAQATRKAARQERGPQRTPWQELCWDQQRLCSPAAAPPAAPVMYTSRIPSPLPRAEGWRQGSRHQRAQSIQPGGPLLPARCLQPRGAASIPPAARATPSGITLRAAGSSRGQNHPEQAQHPPRQIFPLQHPPHGTKQQRQPLNL